MNPINIFNLQGNGVSAWNKEPCPFQSHRLANGYKEKWFLKLQFLLWFNSMQHSLILQLGILYLYLYSWNNHYHGNALLKRFLHDPLPHLAIRDIGVIYLYLYVQVAGILLATWCYWQKVPFSNLIEEVDFPPFKNWKELKSPNSSKQEYSSA